MESLGLKLCIVPFFLLVFLDLIRLTRAAKLAVYFPVFTTMALFGASSIYAFDVLTYEGIYLRQALPDSWQIDSHPEFGYQVINHLAKELGLSFYEFRYFFILLILVLYYVAITKISKWPSIFFLQFYPKLFLIGTISHMRSAIIYPFGYLMLIMAEKRKYFWILALSIALSQIHLSAIFFILLIPLTFFPISKLIIIATVPLALFTHFFLGDYITSLGNALELRQAHYFELEDESKSLGDIEVLRRMAITLLIFILYLGGVIKSDLAKIATKAVLLSVFIYIAFIDAKFIADRLGNLFGIYEPLLFVFWVSEAMKNETKNLLHNRVLAWTATLLYICTDIYLRFFVNTYFPSYDLSVFGISFQ